MQELSEFTLWLLVELIYDPIESRLGRVAALFGTVVIILSVVCGAAWLVLRFVGA